MRPEKHVVHCGFLQLAACQDPAVMTAWGACSSRPLDLSHQRDMASGLQQRVITLVGCRVERPATATQKHMLLR